jgi:putative RecB family exonuclease
MIGDRLPLKQVQECFQQHWRSYAAGNDEIRYGPDKDFESYLTTGVDLLATWYDGISDDEFQVLAVGEAFRFELPNLKAPVIGAIDLILQDPSGSIVIVDHKALGRSYSIEEVDTNLQLTVYHMAAKANGYADHEILLRFDCLIKTKDPKFIECYTTRDHNDERRLVRMAQSVQEAIDKEAFVPNPFGFRHKNCAFKNACEQWFSKGGDG